VKVSIDLAGTARALWRFVALLVLTLLVTECQSAQSAGENPTGGETHFLKSCALDSRTCGSELVCLCGVCSLPCNDGASCGALPGASCALPGETATCALASTGHCDVACAADAECATLSDAHRCVGGVCRANDPAPSACPATQLTANQVLLIGDSFFATGHRIAAFLEELARQSGALLPGERYRDGSSLVGNTLALLGTGIEEQYAAASAESPVGAVLMNGGGADLLIGSCEALTPDCPLLAEAAAAAQALLARMADDGVEHVVYAFYPDPLDAELRSEVDALRPLIASVCEASPLPCHWVDLRPVFEGKYDSYVEADGINPTPEGAQAAAQAISEAMEQACIGR
jgi:hypothetical protein